MRLKALSVTNFRAYAQPTRLELRPLTLLFGRNSSGKSVLLRLLPLLADSIGSNRNIPLALHSRSIRNAGYKHLISKFTQSEKLSFELEWQHETHVSLHCCMDIRGSAEGDQRHLLERITIKVGEHEEWTYLLEEEGSRWNDPHRYLCSTLGKAPVSAIISFFGVLPEPQWDSSQPIPDHLVALNLLAMALNRLKSRVCWLGALRKPPQRMEILTSAPRHPDVDGEGAAMILALEKRRAHSLLLAEVSAWFDKVTDHALDVIFTPAESDLFWVA